MPMKKRDKDIMEYLPHDKISIIKRQPINVKLRDDLPQYNHKLNDKNSNNARHLMHAMQTMSTLRWEANLRDYPKI